MNFASESAGVILLKKGLQIPGCLRPDEGYGRATEAAAGNAAPDESALPAEPLRRGDEMIELWAAHFVVVAQGLVARLHRLAQPDKILLFEGPGKSFDPGHLRHGMAGPPEKAVPEGVAEVPHRLQRE